MVGEALDEAPVEVCEPEEGLDFTFSSGVGHSVTPVTFTGSILTSPSETITDRKSVV